MDNLAELLHVGKGYVLNAVGAERLPIKTFKLGRQRFAHAADVAAHIDGLRKVKA